MTLNSCDTFKLVELVITVVCLGLHIEEPNGAHKFVPSVIYTIAFAGFVMVYVGKLIGIVTDQRLEPLPDVLLSVAAALFNLVAGGTLLEHYANKWYTQHVRDKGLSKGAFATINAAIIFIDIGFVILA